jgi:hypothetical protein
LTDGGSWIADVSGIPAVEPPLDWATALEVLQRLLEIGERTCKSFRGEQIDLVRTRRVDGGFQVGKQALPRVRARLTVHDGREQQRNEREDRETATAFDDWKSAHW